MPQVSSVSECRHLECVSGKEGTNLEFANHMQDVLDNLEGLFVLGAHSPDFINTQTHEVVVNDHQQLVHIDLLQHEQCLKHSSKPLLNPEIACLHQSAREGGSLETGVSNHRDSPTLSLMAVSRPEHAEQAIVEVLAFLPSQVRGYAVAIGLVLAFMSSKISIMQAHKAQARLKRVSLHSQG